MDYHDPELIVCPGCGRRNPPRLNQCFLCNEPLPHDTAKPARPWESPYWDEDRAARTEAVETVMVFIAVIVVCVGGFVAYPGLGILLAILLTPALLRTHVEVSIRRKGKSPVGSGEKALLFLGSLFVVMLTGLAALIAFFITCIPTAVFTAIAGQEGNGYIVLGISGGVAAFVGFSLLRWWWPRRYL